MKQGDKFIVIQEGHSMNGKVIVFRSSESGYGCFEYKGRIIAFPFYSVKPIERFPADDEQPNN
jgi:hypothetical protein